MTSTEPVLHISQLTRHYGGVKALTDANFRLMAGEHVAIVGDNGEVTTYGNALFAKGVILV